MIKGYIGLLGEGKTLNMVYDLMEHLKNGRRVITNTPISFVEKKKEYHAEFINNGYEFQKKLLTEENCVFAIDEASIFFPSQFWNKLSGEYIMRFAQARKYQTDIYYTSQGWNHTIKRLRDLTNVVAKCRSIKYPFVNFKIYKAIHYDPEFFAQRIIASPSVERKYILSTRTLYPSQQRKVFRAYQTMYRVEASALTDIKIKPTNSIVNEEKSDDLFDL